MCNSCEDAIIKSTRQGSLPHWWMIWMRCRRAWQSLYHDVKRQTLASFLSFLFLNQLLKQWRGKLVSYIQGNPNFRYFSVDLVQSETNFLLRSFYEISNFYIHKFQWQIVVIFYFDVGVSSAPEYLYSSIFISYEQRDQFIPLGNQSYTRMASAPPRSRFFFLFLQRPKLKKRVWTLSCFFFFHPLKPGADEVRASC